MINLKSFILFTLIGIICGMNSCTNSFNKENFLMCRTNLENDRKKIRAEGGYSYEAKTFEECRSPAHYGL